MARNSGANVANGILSGVVLASGITFSVLIALLFGRIAEFYVGSSGFATYSGYASKPVWSTGFGYMIPGLIGVIASLVQQKGGYIVEMVFYILALLNMGIFFIIGFIALTAMSLFSYSGCHSVGSSCICLNGLSANSINIGYSCEDINSLSSLSIGICAMLVIGWIFALIACITGGILACQQETQPGVIIQTPQYQPAPTVMQMGTMGVVQPQQGFIIQPGYGVQQGYLLQNPAQQNTNQAYNPGDTKEQP